MSSELTTIGQYTFFGCQYLSEITFSKDINNIQHIQANAFYECKDLNIDLSQWTKLERIETKAFMSGISGIERTVNFPASIKVISPEAFSTCQWIKTINFPKNTNIDSIGDNAFASCINLLTVNFNASVTTFGEDIFFIQYH